MNDTSQKTGSGGSEGPCSSVATCDEAAVAIQVVRHGPLAGDVCVRVLITALLCLVGLAVDVGKAAWKVGTSGLKADAPPVATKPQVLKRPEKPTLTRLDVYGDPLPPKALARLGTMRWRGLDVHERSLFYTPDGKYLVTGHGGPMLWEVATGKRIIEYCPVERPGAFVGHGRLGDTISPDGRFLVCWPAVLEDPNVNSTSEMCVYETMTGKMVRRFEPGRQQYAFFPDGEMIAIRGEKEFSVRELRTGKMVWEHKIESHVDAKILVSPDGKIVATGDKGEVILWKALTGKKIRTLANSKLHGSIDVHAFSPNGKTILVYDPNEILYATDVDTSDIKWIIKPSMGTPLFKSWVGASSAQFSPDGKIVATCGAGCCFWDAATGEQLLRWHGTIHLDYSHVRSLAFSPNGKVLAHTLDAPVIKFVDVASGKELPSLKKIQAHEDLISSANFLADGDTLISSSFDGTIRRWNTRTGVCKQVWKEISSQPGRGGQPTAIECTGLSPDGKLLAYAVKYMKMDEKTTLPEAIKAVGTHIHIRVFDATTWKELRCLNCEAIVFGIIFSPNNKWLAAHVQVPSKKGEEVWLWDTASGERIGRTIPGAAPVFSPDGAILITLEGGGGKGEPEVMFWEVATGKKVASSIQPRETISARHRFSLSRDGRMLVIDQGHGITDRLDWEGKRGKNREKQSRKKLIWVYPLYWHGEPSRVRIWRARRIASPYKTGGSHGYHPAISPDNRLIASFIEHAQIVCLWETASGKLRDYFPGHIGGEITALQFAPDGRRLVSGAEDSTLLVWDVTGRLEDDGSLRKIKRSAEELEALWRQLASDDACQAGRAVWEMVAAESSSVALIARKLQPAAVDASQQEVARLIRDLDAKSFDVRKRAAEKLRKVGRRCEMELLKTLAKNPTAEVRIVLEQMLDAVDAAKMEISSEELRTLRALEVVEQIGTLESRDLLRKLAAGARGDLLTESAKESLNRLENNCFAP